MRIGIRVTAEEVSAAGVASDGRMEFARRRFRGSAARPVAEVITRLRRVLAEAIASVVFDVSGLLTRDEEARVVSVLIEPRRPLTSRRHLWREDSMDVRAVHVRGGHNALGQELFPLDEADLQRLGGEIPAGAHVVVSAAGSPGNSDHEHRAAEALRSGGPVASITESHSFYGDSLLAREYTAVLNAVLAPSAERIASHLSDAVAAAAGDAVRSFVATNEGGCTPLSRLPITPVHSFRADVAGEILGAARVGGRVDGRVIVARPGAVRISELLDGVPAVVSRTALPDGTSLASSFAHVVPLTDLLLSGTAEPPLTVLAEGAEAELAPFGLAPAITTGIDLVALGAAVAPMSHWYNRVVEVHTPADIAGALTEGEAIARANLVAAGADPGEVRIAESRVLATTYSEAQMVRIRVRAVAPTPVVAAPQARRVRSMS